MSKRKNCARCMTPTPATTVGSFAYENVRYEIRLCESHATMFDRDMVGWLRLATEVDDPPSRAQPLRASRRLEGGPPIRLLIPKAPPREIVLDDDPEPPEWSGFSEFAMGFDLTDHARKRMAERGISSAEVYRAIDSPYLTRAVSERDDGKHVYRAEGIKLVVDERTRTVVTAARERAAKELIS